jgi:hypothetical protein
MEDAAKRVWFRFNTHVIGDSKSEWTVSKVFQKLWVRLLEVYDDIKGIRWMWQ